MKLSKVNDTQKSIVIVTHKLNTHPDDELLAYLNEYKYANVLHICHSFYEAPDRCSYYSWYQNGTLYKQARSKDYQNLPEMLIYVKEMFFSVWWVLTSGKKWDVYIGMDGLCVLFGFILKLFGKTKKVIYWAIDFVPNNRFGSSLKNKIYHWVNTYGNKNADEMWDLSPRMKEAREDFLGFTKDNYKIHKVVPYGVWTQRIKKYSFAECEQHTLVFMGHLLEKQGAQLAIQALPELMKNVPDIKLKIIGGGPYKDDLVKIAQELNVSDRCIFLGKIPDHRDLENEIAKSSVALAPYIKHLDTWTYYADPGKVKTYLACGIPTILTGLPWNAQDVQKSRCGIIVSEEISDIVANILKLLDKDLNQEYRTNAIAFSQSYDYKTIFDNLKL